MTGHAGGLLTKCAYQLCACNPCSFRIWEGAACQRPARDGGCMTIEEQDDSDIDTALGVMINLSGKMRMLSHRVAMFALLAAAKPAMAMTACDALDRALAEFNDINLALQQ